MGWGVEEAGSQDGIVVNGKRVRRRKGLSTGDVLLMICGRVARIAGDGAAHTIARRAFWVPLRLNGEGDGLQVAGGRHRYAICAPPARARPGPPGRMRERR